MVKKEIENTNNTKLPNKIDEYLKQQEDNSKVRSSRELFIAEKDDIDLKTDLDITEIHDINVLMVNDAILESCNIEPVFASFYGRFLRLKISHDRKSRQEFVQINSEEKTTDLLERVNNLDSISKSRK